MTSRAALEDELLSWMANGDWSRTPDRFERLALALFRIQYATCDPYARLCRSIDHTPDSVEKASEIPAVPTGAFKEFALRGFGEDQTILTFRTSGTSMDRRGELHLDRLELYEASLLASLRHALLCRPAGGPPIDRMRFLASSPDESSDSSLSHMFGTLREAEGGTDCGFDLRGDRIDFTSLLEAVRRAQDANAPMLIAGTAFAFVHFLDEADASGWQLPTGSRIMETGGFKGKSRAVARDDLHAQLAARFAIPEASVLNQYGMTELGSQFYDSTLVDPTGPRRKLAPPWTRVRFIDPTTSLDVATGERGLILIQDLANTGSIASIQTADIGHAVLDAHGEMIGFDVQGRAEGAEARGCSIATDIMLEASRTQAR